VNDSQTPRNAAEKLSLLFLVIGAIAWLGGANIRGILSNHLLVMGTLEFEPNLNPDVEREVFRLINYSSIVTLLGYATVFIAGIVFLRSTRLALKTNGWLMMAALLFYIFSPAEIYTSYLDGKMISLELWGSPETAAFRELLIARIAALKGLPLVALLCYYTAIGLAVWQPMKKKIVG
jgi:hypothetical protein